ncbi:MAG: metal-dependent transcriptional regulator [Thermoanaerobaculia bacterium]
MIEHPVTDEVLERLWYLRESGRPVERAEDLRVQVAQVNLDAALAELTAANAVRLHPLIELLPVGEERARGIVRRHRLAEILFTEVLEADMYEAEASACEFEHMLSERVVDRVCTFLGHPPKCPHGKPIPQGLCCRKFDRKVEPLITRLYDLPVGGSGKIVFITPRSSSRLNRLAMLGVIPGTTVRLMQRRPSIVIACGETSIAVEEEIANEIFVRPEVRPQ